MSSSEDDVPSPIDLRDPEDAAQWVLEADQKRPFRAELRARIATEVKAASAKRVLELGSGPGLLAEVVLREAELTDYVLLDFSEPMLAMSRQRLKSYSQARFVCRDFRAPDWACTLDKFDAIVAMQAVHEIRHKRHVPSLYAQLASLLVPGGLLLVCDHRPADDAAKSVALFMTDAEQHAAMRAAGFTITATLAERSGLLLYRATL